MCICQILLWREGWRRCGAKVQLFHHPAHWIWLLKCAAANFIDGALGALRCSSPSAKKLKPAKPLRFEVVCRLLPEFYWGSLCYLAHASHPAESKCSQSKGALEATALRQQAAEGRESRGSWEARALRCCQKRSPSRLALLHPPLLIKTSRKKNAEQTPLTSVWPVSRAVEKWKRVLRLNLSGPVCVRLRRLPPSHSFKTGGEQRDRQKKSNITFGPYLPSTPEHVWPQTWLCPSLWRPSSRFDFSQMVKRSDRLNFPSVTLTTIYLRPPILMDFVWTSVSLQVQRLWLECWFKW